MALHDYHYLPFGGCCQSAVSLLVGCGEAQDVAVAVAMKKGAEDLDAVNKALAEISKESRQEIMDTAIANQPVSQY